MKKSFLKRSSESALERSTEGEEFEEEGRPENQQKERFQGIFPSFDSSSHSLKREVRSREKKKERR
jgi:hypothetical protein